MVETTDLIQFGLNGLATGGIIALSAVGLTLVYGILNLSNFSHGDLLTAGAYLSLFFLAMIPLGEASLWAVGLAVLLSGSAVLDRTTRRSLSRTEAAVLHAVAAGLLGLGLGARDPGYAPAWVRWGAPVLLLAAGAALASWRPEERSRALLSAAAAAALAAGWLWSTPLLLSIGLAVALVAGLAAGLELAVWRPLRHGRLLPASHLLIGGFVGWVVGLVLTAQVDALAPWRGTVAAATALAGGLASWRLLGPRPVARANLVTYIIVSIGVAFAIRYALAFRFGTGLRSYPLPTNRARPVLEPVGVDWLVIPEWQWVTLVTVVVVLALLHPLLTFTKFGKSVRALADNLELARITGVPVDRVVLQVWLLAGALTAIAGTLLALNIGSLSIELGWHFLLLMFAAVILGGIGSVYGSLLGAMVIGLTTELSVLLLDSRYKFAAAFFVLIVILLVRPQGLFGVKT